jgi:hypothetical protein
MIGHAPGGVDVTRRQHALSRAMYEVDGDGNVVVTALDGTSGVFTSEGVWLRGELRECDPNLAGWLAGPQIPPRLAVLPRFRPTGDDRLTEVTP